MLFCCSFKKFCHTYHIVLEVTTFSSLCNNLQYVLFNNNGEIENGETENGVTENGETENGETVAKGMQVEIQCLLFLLSRH